jgi:hypothetical protein
MIGLLNLGSAADYSLAMTSSMQAGLDFVF